MLFNYKLVRTKNNKPFQFTTTKWLSKNKGILCVLGMAILIAGLINLLVGLLAGMLGAACFYCYAIWSEVKELDFTNDLKSIDLGF